MILPIFNPMEVENPCPRQMAVKVFFRLIPVKKEMAYIQTDAQPIVADNPINEIIGVIENLHAQVPGINMPEEHLHRLPVPLDPSLHLQ
jgi:hypothetical protein